MRVEMLKYYDTLPCSGHIDSNIRVEEDVRYPGVGFTTWKD